MANIGYTLVCIKIEYVAKSIIIGRESRKGGKYKELVRNEEDENDVLS